MRKSLSWAFYQSEKDKLGRELKNFIDQPSDFVKEFIESGEIDKRLALVRAETDTPWITYTKLYNELLWFFGVTAGNTLRWIVCIRWAMILLAVDLPLYCIGKMFEIVPAVSMSWVLGALEILLVGTGFVNFLPLRFRSRGLKRRIITMNWLSTKANVHLNAADVLIESVLEFLVSEDVFLPSQAQAKMNKYGKDMEFRTFNWGYIDEDGDDSNGYAT